MLFYVSVKDSLNGTSAELKYDIEGKADDIMYYFGKMLYSLELMGFEFSTGTVFEACKIELASKVGGGSNATVSYKPSKDICITARIE